MVASKHPEKRLRETIQDLEATDRPPQVKDARTGQLVLELKQEKGAVAQHVVGGLKAVSSLVTAAALYKGAAAYAASQRPRALRDLMFTPLGQGSGLMAAAGLSSVFLSNMTGKYGKALQGTRETCGELRSTIDAITKAPSNTVKELIPRPKAIGSMIGKVLQSHQIDDANYE